MKRNISIVLTFILFGILFFCGFDFFAKAQTFKSTEKFIVCIDAGHQSKGDLKTEPIVPGSSERKARVSAGATGIGTKKPEYAVNLEAAIILNDILTEKGYEVIMTRESNNVTISNVERAQLANNAKANMTIRLHCDYIDNTGKTGTIILVPSQNGQHTKEIYVPSKNYADILKNKLKAGGIGVNGIFERADITGFNWSKVPVIILEMGFMSNYNDDQLLSSPDYQKKLMLLVSEALDEYRTSIHSTS